MTDLFREQSASPSSDCPPCPGEPVAERIAAREAKIGENFIVRRAVPSKARRMVGAWCFLDHAGPAEYAAGKGLNVGPHPHIGLQTFTWMLDGEVLHRDSLGYEQIIRPGQVNLMTAGRGIVHSEESVSDAPGRLHAAQLWIALPEAERHREPGFHHYPDLPVMEQDGVVITLLAGSAMGRTSPAEVFSPLVGMDLRADAPAQTTIPLEPRFEHALLSLRGTVTAAGEVFAPGTLLYLGTGRTHLAVELSEASQALVIGGQPFGEDILLWWNFVARSAEEIHQATEDWNAGRRFGSVDGTPLPRIPAPDTGGMTFKQPARRT
ncbi:MAG: pirin family protein [Ectothiorhodospiraceae bacterium]|nr:pirin family protein [Ectothiorhodospiraceae bacterium]MCH8505760.1 pirin family protein [Ectothiorhodospiraceae bacterium]